MQQYYDLEHFKFVIIKIRYFNSDTSQPFFIKYRDYLSNINLFKSEKSEKKI